MVRKVALALLLACAIQGLVDTVWCPDGCLEAPASQSTATHQTARPGVCLYCGTGFVVNTVVNEGRPLVIVTQVVPTGLDTFVIPASRAIDHPPRTA